MGLFKWLPNVNRFCWCTKNLKCASLIIIFLGMLASISTASVLCTPSCKELYSSSSPFKTLSNILRWVLFSCELILMASLFAYLFGIFWSLSITADILIVSVFLTCVITITYSIVITIHEQYTGCRWYHSQKHNFLLHTIMWGYFVLVINTYAEQMNSSSQ